MWTIGHQGAMLGELQSATWWCHLYYICGLLIVIVKYSVLSFYKKRIYLNIKLFDILRWDINNCTINVFYRINISLIDIILCLFKWIKQYWLFVFPLQYACDIEAEVVGKPSPSFYNVPLQDMGVAPQHVSLGWQLINYSHMFIDRHMEELK